MRRLIAATIFATSAAIGGQAAPIAAVLDIGARAIVDVGPNTRVNVRATPQIAADNIVGAAAAGTEVRVVGVERSGQQVWYRVRALDGSFEGWIRGDLLGLRPEEPTSARPDGEAASTQVAAPAPPSPPVRPRPANDWSANLRELLPAIDSCIGHSSAPPVVTLKARMLPLDMVEVLLRDAAGRYWSCIIDRHGGTPIAWNPVTGPAAMGAGEPNPQFYRQAGAPAADRCHDLEPVRDERDGTLVGTLVYDVCR